ncbi:MAG TPA: 50S ribosomal protein L15 [Myxococcota bacterium]|nr:50S ribosomal protein L15 [Myxococcota bacterium]
MLERLAPRRGATRPAKRVGRGPGSGTGKTSGRGTKGQGKRSPGRETPFGFEGGQMPLARRLPKRGFHNPHSVEYQIVNLASLGVFEPGATVDAAALLERGLIRRGRGGVKILGQGDAPKRLKLQVDRVSESARKKIEAAGGSVELRP